MIDIVLGNDRKAFQCKMEAMFAERKLVFVDLLKWPLPVTDDRYEIDQFDDDDAVYFIAALNDGSHLGSLRLLRTDRPHILGSLFPHLADDPVPAGPDTREITRLCLAPRLRASERRLVRNQLISAMVDYALANGIRTLTGVARTSWLAQIQAMGWRCRTLGAPQPVDGTPTGAFRIAIETSTPKDLVRTGVYVAATSRFFVTYAATEPASPSGDPIGWSQRLLVDGYCIIPDLVPSETVRALNADLDARFAATPLCQGGFYGPRTKRFGSLLKRSAVAADLVQHPLVLGLAKAVLGPWCDRFNLNLTQAIEIHPGAPAQFPHRDQDMWQGEKGRFEYLLNVVWPLTEFTAENGATRIWPGSHYPGALDQVPHEKPVAIEMQPGSALVFLGSTLHAAGGNYARSASRGVIVSYCLGWLKPYENQWLCYPPDIARGFSPELAELVGYCQHRPNLGNYEGRSPAILLEESPPEFVGAADALRPDQETALAEFLADQAAEAPADPPTAGR